jgi:hypothetical protein
MIDLNDFLVKGEKWLYDTLAKYKQDVLPNDVRLQIDYRARNQTFEDYFNEYKDLRSFVSIQ